MIKDFWCFCLVTKIGVGVFLFFYKLKKRMERREMIKRKTVNLEKALKNVIF